MKITVYSCNYHENDYFEKQNHRHQFIFTEKKLTLATASLAKDCEAICCFVTDTLDQSVLSALAAQGVKLILLRSAGYDHIDLDSAHRLGLTVTHVPEYSPEAVAEFAVSLILSLSRKIPEAITKIKQQDFTLHGLLGFNLHQKKIGIIGTGHIGTAFARIMHGFGCELWAFDPYPNKACENLGVKYAPLAQVLDQADIVSLHCLLNASTQHIINTETIALMKKGVMLINTGRGALIDTPALIAALETGQIGAAGLDVYEHEKDLFFADHSQHRLTDTQFLKLNQLPHVIITGHMAFFTEEAMSNIAKTTIANIDAFEYKKPINVI